MGRQIAVELGDILRSMRWWNPASYVRMLAWVLFAPQRIALHLEEEPPTPELEEVPGTPLPPRRADIAFIAMALGVGLAAVGFLVVLILTPLRPDWRIVATTVLFCLISGGLILTTISLSAAACFWVVMPVLAGLALSIQFVLAPILETWEMVVFVALSFGVVGGHLASILLIFGRGPIRPYWLAWLVWFLCAGLTAGVAYAVLSSARPALSALLAAPSLSVGRASLRLFVGRLAQGLVGSMAFGLAFTVFYLRPIAWLLSLPARVAALDPPEGVAAVTPVSLFLLQAQLVRVLRVDPNRGILLARETLDQTMQFTPVMEALAVISQEIDGELTLPYLARVAERIPDPEVLHYLCESLPHATAALAVDTAFVLPRRTRDALLDRMPRPKSQDAPSSQVARALWQLRLDDPRGAVQTLAAMKRRTAGERQLMVMAALLARLQQPTDMPEIAALGADQDLLHGGMDLGPIGARVYPAAWRLIYYLLAALPEVGVVLDGDSRPARSQALNRAMDQVRSLLDGINSCPMPVRGTLGTIGERWLDLLVDEAHRVLERRVPNTAVSPYVLGTPVTDQRFVGRAALLQRLRNLWQTPQGPPVVMLYGQRRVGKTSLLHRLGADLGQRALFVYTNLSVLGDAPRGGAEILATLASAIAVKLREVGREIDLPGVLANPQGDTLVNPYREFEAFLRGVRERIGRDRLILALDEFEMVERWIGMGRVQIELFRVLRSYSQTDPYISFVFCGLPRLSEIAGTFFQPFLGIVPVKVGFFAEHETARTLECPDNPAFSLEYAPEAIELIHSLTAGHPYLVQLVGHCLVGAYNRGETDNATFHIWDVEAVTQRDAELYQVGDYYLTGVWDQVTSGQPHVAELLRAMAARPGGLAVEEIERLPEMAQHTASDVLGALADQDVVVYEGALWRIKVELMRRWLAAV